MWEGWIGFGVKEALAWVRFLLSWAVTLALARGHGGDDNERHTYGTGEGNGFWNALFIFATIKPF